MPSGVKKPNSAHTNAMGKPERLILYFGARPPFISNSALHARAGSCSPMPKPPAKTISQRKPLRCYPCSLLTTHNSPPPLELMAVTGCGVSRQRKRTCTATVSVIPAVAEQGRARNVHTPRARDLLEGEGDMGGNSRAAAERLQGVVKAVGGRLLTVGNAIGAGVGVGECLWGRVRAVLAQPPPPPRDSLYYPMRKRRCRQLLPRPTPTALHNTLMTVDVRLAPVQARGLDDVEHVGEDGDNVLIRAVHEEEVPVFERVRELVLADLPMRSRADTVGGPAGWRLPEGLIVLHSGGQGAGVGGGGGLLPPPTGLEFLAVPKKNFPLNGPAPKAPEKIFHRLKGPEKNFPNHFRGGLGRGQGCIEGMFARRAWRTNVLSLEEGEVPPPLQPSLC